jgi:ABC-type transport system substrate-binding protein
MFAEDSSGDKFTALARNLRELRSNKGLRQEDVARHLEVATPTYSSWERGRTEPDVSTLLELSRFFDVTVDKLLRSEPRPLRIGSWYPSVGKFHPIKNPAGIFTRIYPLIFSTLYCYDIYDRRFDIELIDSWKVVKDEDRSSYTFYLRHNVRFHSGDPLELEDVKMSYDLFIYLYPFYGKFIDNVEVKEEEHAVKLNLLKFLDLEFLPIPYIIPRSYLTRETWDEDDECFDGTGPFKVADEEQKKRLREGLNQPVTLKCNDNYFGKIASIPAIEIHKTSSDKPEELREMFLNGAVDLAYDLDLEESDMSLEESDEYRIEKDNRSIISYYLVLDRNSNICRDENVREAVDYAINRERIVKMLDIKTATVLPATHMFLILRAEVKGLGEHDPAKASSCWEKALSSLEKNGVEDTTLRVGSTHYGNSVIFRMIGEVVEQLKAVGIDAEREENQSKAHAFVEMLKFIFPRVIYNTLHSSRTSGLPWSNNSEKLDALLDDIKGMETYRQIQQELTEQRLFLPLLSRGIIISHVKELNTNYRLRGTNAPYGPDIVHWRFQEPT